MDERPERPCAFAPLASGEPVDPQWQADGDVGMPDVREQEVKLHVFDLGVPAVDASGGHTSLTLLVQG